MSSSHVLESLDDGTVVRIPRAFRTYRYVKTLGFGSSSIVCLVTDSRSKEFFAAKVISRSIFENRARLEHFERELRLMGTIKHPSVVQLHDVVYLPDVVIMILDYCERGDILDFMYEHGVPDSDELKVWLRQLLSALEYIHSRGLVHRDLKPENLFLDSDLNLKIGDFGLAHESHAGKLMKTVVGTLCYTAPEILRREEYDGERADIWSVGIITYTMAAGTLPWRAIGDIGMRREIIEGSLERPEDFDPDMKEFLEACLKADPSKRATAKELLEMRVLKGPRRPRGEERKVVRTGWGKNAFTQPIRTVQSQRLASGRYFVPHGVGVKRLLRPTPSVRCL